MASPTPASRRELLVTALSLAGASALPRGGWADVTPMRAWETGAPAHGDYGLRLVERAAPRPGPGEVLVKVHATGLNARDLSLLKGVRIYGTSDTPRRIPLDDNAGEVLAVGSGVTRVQPGDRVVCTHFPLWVDGAWDDEAMSVLDFGVNADGFLAEQAVVPAAGLVRLPESIAYTDAASFPNAGLTAWNAVVVQGAVKPGDTVLTLGSGGVSVFGLQWAKLLGARVIITSSSEAKLSRLRELGADGAVNYRSNPDWHEAVLDLTDGRGVDVVLNTVGISEMERCLLSCGSNGRVMLIGANPVGRGAAADGSELRGLENFPRGMIMKGLRIQGIIVGSRRMLEDMVQAVVASGIRPVVDRVYPFDQAPDAVRYMASGAKIGKVMIAVTPEAVT
jgi:NADPH:quinone reductase-like Zn-dependent oxidoreductase